MKGDGAIELGREDEFLASRSQRLSQIQESGFCAVLGGWPCGRLHEGETGLCQRLPRRPDIIGNCLRFLTALRQNLRNGGHVFERARKDANRVERCGFFQNAIRREKPIRRLQRVKPAKRSGTNDGAIRLRPERNGNHARGHRRRRAG